jgi:hypothetical protein
MQEIHSDIYLHVYRCLFHLSNFAKCCEIKQIFTLNYKIFENYVVWDFWHDIPCWKSHWCSFRSLVYSRCWQYTGIRSLVWQVKLSLHAIKPNVGVRVIAPLILNLGVIWREWSASVAGRFICAERAPGTHWTAGWWAPVPVWTLRRRERSLAFACSWNTIP